MRTREVWLSIDDFGYRRRLVVDYDERDNTEVSRVVMHDLLTLAGLRRDIDEEDA